MAITFKKSEEQNTQTTRMTGRSPFRNGLKFTLVRKEQITQYTTDASGNETEAKDGNGNTIKHWVLVVKFLGKTKEHYLFPTMAYSEKIVNACPAAPNGVAENSGTFFDLIRKWAEDDACHYDSDVLDKVLADCIGKQIAIKRISWAATATDKQGNTFPTSKATFEMNIEPTA